MHPAARLIQNEIDARGPMPFARFMELALYAPDCGYYERGGGDGERPRTGRAGDFYTSVSVGPMFGEWLAWQFAEWSRPIEASPVIWIEAGAHDAQLAEDILKWTARQRPDLRARLVYWILEPSPRQQRRQKKKLERFQPAARWARDWDEIGGAIDGVIFSNELLDAMPVRRLGWDAQKKQWFEWGVGAEAGRFVWTRLPLRNAQFAPRAPAELLPLLPDGFTTETHPAAIRWWEEAARRLGRGKLATFDYGLDALDFFRPERASGTLRGYWRHRFAEDLLANVGEQDLTAHVNFSAIRHAGEEAGLTMEFDGSQAEFLTGILRRMREGGGPVPWDASRVAQFKTLIHPEHLGRAFRVLAQAR